MDKNPHDADHWWHELSEKNPIGGRFPWKFYRQPGGVLEVSAKDLPENPEANGFVFSGGKWWMVNPSAENKSHLPDGYYEQLLGGKNADWIRCYAEGKFTFVQEGRPVWPEYDDEMMSADVQYDPQYPLQIGVDFGLTPAAVFGQKMHNGRWHVVHA